MPYVCQNSSNLSISLIFLDYTLTLFHRLPWPGTLSHGIDSQITQRRNIEFNL